MLRSVNWQLGTEVSAQPVGSGTDRLSRNVSNYNSAQR